MSRRPQPDVWATGLRLPSAWVCRSAPGAPDSGVTLVAGPGSAVTTGGVPPQLVVRLMDAGADEQGWLDDLLDELEEQPGFDVEDEDRLLDPDQQDLGYLRYSHRASGGGPELLSERWSWWCEGVGLTLTGTLVREDYEIWCDLFEAVAATVDATRLGHVA